MGCWSTVRRLCSLASTAFGLAFCFLLAMFNGPWVGGRVVRVLLDLSEALLILSDCYANVSGILIDVQVFAADRARWVVTAR